MRRLSTFHRGSTSRYAIFRSLARVLVLALIVVPTSNAVQASGAAEPTDLLLPPVLAWSGESERLIVPSDHPWMTPAERDGLASSPSYDEALAWLDRLVDASPRLEQVVIGKTHEAREIVMIVASKEGAKTAAALPRTAGDSAGARWDHAGEIDGKDAG